MKDERPLEKISKVKRRRFIGLSILGLVSLPVSGISNLTSSASRSSPLDKEFLNTGLKMLPDLFIMDGHIHVMSRQLLQNLDIGNRYKDGTVDLPRIIEGGLNALFFSVYTPEPYLPGHYEVKNTFRVIELALDEIKKNNKYIELALTASEIEKISSKGKIAAFL